MCGRSQAGRPRLGYATGVTAASRESKAQIETLLQRWRSSLDLHQRYAALDDEHYFHVQPWPKHERPVAWIIKLAQEKLSALERITRQRLQQKDRDFIEAMELMAFLANLVGLQNIERYVPLADPATERRDVLKAPASAKPASEKVVAREDATREMPALQPGKVGRLLLAQRAGVPYKPRSAKSIQAQKLAAQKLIASAKEAVPKPAPRSVEAMVVDDVLRLIGWGRATHELPDLIASMSGRPNAAGVRKIIKDYRVHIERQLGGR